MRKGYLFAFEGIDGSGKTTQVKILSEKFKRRGVKIFVSKASVVKGNKHLIDSFIKKFAFRRNSLSVMFLFQALHTYQREKVQEALYENKIVIADRWSPSFWIYHQNFGPLKDQIEYLEVFNQIAFQGLVPEITFLLDLPVKLAYQRRDGRGLRDIFEEETHNVFSLAKTAYLKMAKNDDKWVVIDASRTKSEIGMAVWEKIKMYI